MQRPVMLVVFAMLGVAAVLAPVASTQQTAPAAPAAAQERARLLELQRAAVGHLRAATRSGAPVDEVRRALSDASRSLDALGVEPLPAPVRADLRRAAADLIALPPADTQRVAAATAPILTLLEKVRSHLEGEIALGLTFEGSYSQTKPAEPAYGGHASSMGPAPATMTSPEDAAPVLVTFEEGARLPSKMFCGGPTKDHILESACGGVALFDYDGDGRLDIYLVTAAELGRRASASLIATRSIATSADGSSRTCRRPRASMLAAWGNGACAGDSDGDGRLDLYVTNWGPNFLFRNRGDGTFEDVAGRTGVAAGGWSTGCTFFDADADGDLDLYVARYVETTWDSVVRARRDAHLAERPDDHGRPARACPASPICSSRTSAADASSKRPQRTACPTRLAPTASASSRPTMTTTGSSICSWRTTRTRTSCIATSATADSRASDLPAGVARERRRPRAGGDGRRRRRLRRRRAHGPRAHDVRARSLHALSQSRRPPVRRRERAERPRRPDVRPHGMGRGVSRRRSRRQARSVLRQRPHLLGHRATTRSLGKPTGRRTSCCSTPAAAVPRCLGARRARVCRSPASAAASPSGDLDNDGDPDVVVSNMDDTPTLLENRQRTAHTGWRCASSSPAGNRFAIGAKVTVSGGGRNAAARDPLGRQLPLAERSAAVLRPGRLRRPRGRGGPHARSGRAGQWKQLRRRSPAHARALRRQQHSPGLVPCDEAAPLSRSC